MSFGKPVGSLKSLKEQLKKGSGGGTFIKSIPAEDDGAITIRFLDEPENWVQYVEVYDPVRRRYYPMPDEGMPGYPDPEDRVSTRYLANAVVIDGGDERDKDKVIPLKLPKDLTNQLVVRYERYETICDRDYELFRTGTGKETTYGQSPEAPTKRNMAKYKAVDLQAALQSQYDSVWSENGDAPKPSSSKAKPKTGRRTVAKDAEPEAEDTADDAVDWDELATLADDDDNVEAQDQLADAAVAVEVDFNEYETWAEVLEAVREAGGADEVPFDAAPEAEDGEPEVDDAVEEDDDPDAEGESEFYTQEELEAKTIGELRAIARDNEISTRGMKSSDIIDALMGE